MKRQQVYVSRTQSSRIGLFTDGMLVCRLTVAEALDQEQLKTLCERWDFKLVENPWG